MSDLDRRTFLGTVAAGGVTLAGGGAMAAETFGHVVLLGDSILDNGAYVPGGPAVIDQLRDALPAGRRATLAAVDGSVTRDTREQLARLPADASHVVISSGGNDALAVSDVFRRPVRSVGESAAVLADVRDAFARQYDALAAEAARRALPTALCTVYDPNFPIAADQRAAVVGLCLFNDVITRAATRHGFPVIDLRVLFNDPGDYANPIEPSAKGGAKIVDAIERFIGLK